MICLTKNKSIKIFFDFVIILFIIYLFDYFFNNKLIFYTISSINN